MRAYVAGIATATLTLCATTTTVAANEFEDSLKRLAAEKIIAQMQDPAIVAAIQTQNQINEGMTSDQIEVLDKRWRAEVGSSSSPTIDPVLNNAVADMLRALRDDSQGLFTEVFVMDALGLNVAASDTTSDYWQGDEAKWQKTYQVGANSLHISDVELDESTQSYQSQISVPIVDPATNQPIGAATVGVNVEYLE